jgi:hypothetical protein
MAGMAGDEVGVEPDRLAKLASALENLRNVLAHNVPTIVNTLEQYWNGGTGTPVNLNPLKQAQARSPQDAVGMRSRSDLAQAWMANGANIDVVSSGIAYIPWDTADVDTADAQLRAQQLAAAEKSGNLAQIQAIQADIQDHIESNDSAWLTAFYNQAAPQVANLAATLNSEDGKNGSFSASRIRRSLIPSPRVSPRRIRRAIFHPRRSAPMPTLRTCGPSACSSSSARPDPHTARRRPAHHPT